MPDQVQFPLNQQSLTSSQHVLCKFENLQREPKRVNNKKNKNHKRVFFNTFKFLNKRPKSFSYRVHSPSGIELKGLIIIKSAHGVRIMKQILNRHASKVLNIEPVVLCFSPGDKNWVFTQMR